MATEQKLITELVRAKMINAKREFEAARTDYCRASDDVASEKAAGQREHWDGQYIMAKQLLDILEGV